MSGLLSQALANLEAAEQQVATLSNLPPAAQQIQAESAAAISPLSSQIRSIQNMVGNFIGTAGPELSVLETMAAQGQSTSSIEEQLADVQNAAATLKSNVDEASGRIQAASSQVFGYFDQLAAIRSELTAQINTLQGQMNDAQSAEAAASKRYYYLLALGPLGIAELAAALSLYMKWKSEVNNYAAQASSLSAQINTLSQMESACQQLEADLQSVATKILDVKNSTDFLSSDILEINSDLASGSALPAITLMVKAAITETSTLAIDAS